MRQSSLVRFFLTLYTDSDFATYVPNEPKKNLADFGSIDTLLSGQGQEMERYRALCDLDTVQDENLDRALKIFAEHRDLMPFPPPKHRDGCFRYVAEHSGFCTTEIRHLFHSGVVAADARLITANPKLYTMGVRLQTSKLLKQIVNDNTVRAAAELRDVKRQTIIKDMCEYFISCGEINDNL